MVDLIFKNVILNRNNFTFELDFTFNNNGIYGIIGPNGSGKTTFLELATAILKPTSGNIYYGKENLTNIDIVERKNLFSVTFVNEPQISFFTIHEFFEISIDNFDFNQFKNKYEEKLPFLGKKLGEISQGQYALLQILQNIYQRTPFIFIDEVFLFLDLKMKKFIMNELKKLQNTKIFILSHDINFIMEHTDYILALKNGNLKFFNNTQNISNEVITKLFFD